MVLKINAICPGCFGNAGHSIVMQEKDGIYHCPKDSQHKFKKNKEGFYERTDLW